MTQSSFCDHSFHKVDVPENVLDLNGQSVTVICVYCAQVRRAYLNGLVMIMHTNFVQKHENGPNTQPPRQSTTGGE